MTLTYAMMLATKVVHINCTAYSVHGAIHFQLQIHSDANGEHANICFIGSIFGPFKQFTV